MKSEEIILNEVQLLLAEKRTSLATIRTGIAVLVLPLSLMGLLVATSKYYTIVHVLALFIPLMGLCSALIATGLYLIIRALVRLKHQDQHILQLKWKDNNVAELIE